MKSFKFFTVFVILGIVAILGSCHSSKITQQPQDIENLVVLENSNTNVTAKSNGDNELLKISNHSFLSEKDENKTFAVTGLLREVDGNWYLFENPKSRSKVTYILTVPRELETAFIEKKDKTVTIQGILTNVRNTWTKEMEVLSVM